MADWGIQDVTLGGVSLKSYGYGIRLIGGIDTVPSKRGTDVQIGYARGTSWRPKRLDAENRTLVMWVDGRESDGSYAATRLLRVARLNANIRELTRLFAREDEQLVITREVLLPAGMETWSGLCEVRSSVAFDSDEDSDQERNLTVDLVFADPLWYGDEQTDTIGGSGSITNPGEVDSVTALLEFSGGSNYVLTNTTLGISLTINVSGPVTVDCAAGTVLADGDNAIGKVNITGSRDFMRLAPGANAMTLSSGSCDVTFRPPRL